MTAVSKYFCPCSALIPCFAMVVVLEERLLRAQPGEILNPGIPGWHATWADCFWKGIKMSVIFSITWVETESRIKILAQTHAGQQKNTPWKFPHMCRSSCCWDLTYACVPFNKIVVLHCDVHNRSVTSPFSSELFRTQNNCCSFPPN